MPLEYTATEKTISSHEIVSEPFVDRNLEKRILRKLDLHLIPIISCLYLLSFLDRVNIGNARLYGMEEDLGLKGDQYQVAVSILFVTYCLFEVPSNLALKKFKPDRYIAFIAISWGVVATCTGLVHSYGSLIAARLILGVVEAGLFPCLVTYLTIFYSRNQLAVRVAYLFVASALAGAVGGMIAYGIGFLDGAHGHRAWRWLLIIEGLPSILCGIVAYFLLPTSPSSACWLTEHEKTTLQTIRRREGESEQAQKFHWADVKEGFKDWQVWIFSLAQFCNDIMLYGFSTFLPSIIKGTGTWTALQAQALTIPVYTLGAGVYLVVAHLSDRQGQRGVYAASFSIIAVVGYCMLVANAGAGVSYAGCFVLAFGLYVAVGMPLAWLPGNKPRYAKRALASGMQLTVGNIAGIVTPFLYSTKAAPHYFVGYGVSIACVFLSACIFTFMTFYYRHVNKTRAAGKEDSKVHGMTEDEIENLGDRSPRYIYQT